MAFQVNDDEPLIDHSDSSLSSTSASSVFESEEQAQQNLRDEQIIVENSKHAGNKEHRSTIYTVATVLTICTTFIIITGIHTVNDNHFDYYVYAQQWPSALCKKINETHHGECTSVPKNVNTWVVHGLWPSRAHAGHHYGPQNCNDSWPFVESKIYPILNELNSYWPNLMQDRAEDSFWEHEWSKHGTCACQNNACSELDYFKIGLSIRNSLNFDGKLKADNISPSNSATYALADIQGTLGPGKYQCYKTSKNATFQVIAQIETCLDKSFNQVDCAQYEESQLQKFVDRIQMELFVRNEYHEECDPESFACGPYNPGTCSYDSPVMIFPPHMPMGLKV